MGNVIGAAGSIFGGVASYYRAKSQGKALDQAAKRTEEEGKTAADRIRARSRRLAGAQRARFAAAGIDLSGSAVDVQYDSAVQFEVDALTSIYQGFVKAASLRTAANSVRMQGRNVLIGSFFSAGSQLLPSLGGGTANTGNPADNPSFSPTAEYSQSMSQYPSYQGSSNAWVIK